VITSANAPSNWIEPSTVWAVLSVASTE
jgi:hypothetical protein